MISPETATKLNDLRARIAANEPFSREELGEAIRNLRSERMTGIENSSAKAAKKKESTLPPDLSTLFK